MLIFIGVERGVFIAKYRIYFTVARGTGLFEGMPVKLSGFKIGKVESLELTDDAKVKAILAINKQYHQWIRQDSMALLNKEGLLGENIIEITLGNMDMPIIQDKKEIRFHRSRGLEDIAEDMLPVLVEIKQIVGYINDPKSDFKQILGNVQILTKDLQATQTHLNEVLKTANQRLVNLDKNSANTLKNIDGLSAHADKTVQHVNVNLPAILDKIDRTLDNLEKTSSNLKATTDSTLHNLPNMIYKGEHLLEDSQEVIGSLKQTWPIRSHIEAPTQRLIESDSHE
jgi:phospholipid/cholesterol/gamma-HCH transport system substrate-binding protein